MNWLSAILATLYVLGVPVMVISAAYFPWYVAVSAILVWIINIALLERVNKKW